MIARNKDSRASTSEVYDSKPSQEVSKDLHQITKERHTMDDALECGVDRFRVPPVREAEVEVGR